MIFAVFVKSHSNLNSVEELQQVGFAENIDELFDWYESTVGGKLSKEECASFVKRFGLMNTHLIPFREGGEYCVVGLHKLRP